MFWCKQAELNEMEKITLNHITKIEGHARLDLQVEDGKLTMCELGSIEGSRHFQGLLKGHSWQDAPEITSRICGICSSAHGVASVMAMENLFGVIPSKQTVILRELQTIGERIRSHATHLYFLALPDYLGYESGLAMAKDYKDEVARAMRLIKLGNDILILVSGRIMHQVATTVGGFTHFPKQSELDEIKQRLIDAENDIMETAKLIASLKIPEFASETKFFSLTRQENYATSYGDVKVGDKIFPQSEYASVLEEYHTPYSNANFVVIEGKNYFVGALARVNNNYNQLSGKAKQFMQEIGFTLPNYNTFANNLAQAIELIHHQETAVKILEDFKVKNEDPIKFEVKAGHGIAANEAPRGTLWHEYKVDDNGKITFANIVAPTTQFLLNMQTDIHKLVQQLLDADTDRDTIKKEVEKIIRACDPCFSCATHFLKLNWH